MKKYRIFWMGLLLGLLGGGGLVYFIRPLPEKTISKRDAALLREELLKTDTIINTMQRSQYDSLMSFVLGQVEKDLENRPDRTLRPETIDQIAALSYVLLPYRQTEGDSISEKKISPERGQLLLLLLASRIDTSSLRLIFEKSSFAHAQLAGAYLAGAYLRGIDLQEADLRGAQLQGADLTSADLRYANLWGAHMQSCLLQSAKLSMADMQWADANEANLDSADLEEANLNAIQLRNARLRGANLEWTQLNGAWLEEADLSGAQMFTAYLTRAQCRGTHFTRADMTSATLIEANLAQAHFNHVTLSYTKLTHADMQDMVVSEEDWMTLLSTWNVAGAEDILQRYLIQPSDTLYVLRPK